ncbi:MAG: class I SAM-dependent methyltransferase [Anaeromyxobacter sp.]|nr:class I SAM-dependent methyltransferase [Anaeromyxobacter sp.]MBL0276490.1 class I SAM-dependent methyltransferase [Anaeromyxobacter sp.]
MAEPSARFWQVFFDLYLALPRQGPGNRASAERALALCGDLPPAPAVADLGCGVGGQTLLLAELTGGTVAAVDSLPAAVERLRAAAAARGLDGRVAAVVGDLARPPLPPQAFDLVWSEGALYNAGLDVALPACRGLLRPGGVVAFTDAVWRVEAPPPQVKASFDFDYPAMGRVPDVLAAIERSGLTLVGHFTLPDEAWWEDFYAPMERRLQELRGRYAGDAEAQAILDRLALEPELHRRWGHTYAYEFFVARRG